jgi:predicted DNA-binding protein (MmcQ/YjbR family)
MRFEAFDQMARALPAAALEIKWGDERVYCVGGKMFAVAGRIGEMTPWYLFKASDLSFEMLVETGVAEPAPYLARARWVRLKAHDALPPETLAAYVREAHGLVAARLPRIRRVALGIA